MLEMVFMAESHLAEVAFVRRVSSVNPSMFLEPGAVDKLLAALVALETLDFLMNMLHMPVQIHPGRELFATASDVTDVLSTIGVNPGSVQSPIKMSGFVMAKEFGVLEVLAAELTDQGLIHGGVFVPLVHYEVVLADEFHGTVLAMVERPRLFAVQAMALDMTLQCCPGREIFSTTETCLVFVWMVFSDVGFQFFDAEKE